TAPLVDPPGNPARFHVFGGNETGGPPGPETGVDHDLARFVLKRFEKAHAIDLCRGEPVDQKAASPTVWSCHQTRIGPFFKPLHYVTVECRRGLGESRTGPADDGAEDALVAQRAEEKEGEVHSVCPGSGLRIMLGPEKRLAIPDRFEISRICLTDISGERRVLTARSGDTISDDGRDIPPQFLPRLAKIAPRPSILPG